MFSSSVDLHDQAAPSYDSVAHTHIPQLEAVEPLAEGC
jgi:hypothetical protein